MGVPLTKSCIISFLYIKPQLMLNELELDDSCIISFLYIKPQHIGIGFILRLSCIISFLYIKPQPRRALQEQHQCCIISFLYIKPQRCNLHKAYVTVVLYRFSTSNHNHHSTAYDHYQLYYIVSLHQTTTGIPFWSQKIRATFPSAKAFIKGMVRLTIGLSTNTTPSSSMGTVRQAPGCSFKVITSCAFFNDRAAGEVKTRLLLSMVFFLLYLAKNVKLKVDALNKCLKLRMSKSYARSKLFVFHICTFLGFYIFGLPSFLIVS